MIEYGGIVILGILAQWLAWRFKVPSILPLIIIGLFVGPFSTIFSGGEKWISPIWDPSTEHGLFPGEGLFHFVELAIGIILFEGSMTLKREELGGVGDTIGKLISLGAVITFVLAGVLAHYVVSLNWSVSFLIASLIIVTGPTVIAPILRNVPLNQNVATVLKWEGILIDPIGALAAVLVYQFISTYEGGNFTSEALSQFLRIIFVSLSLGGVSALAFREALKRDWIPHYLLTISSLAFVLALFVGSEQLQHNSALLTVVISGMVLGNIDVPYIKEIAYFKESLSLLLISILFILLSANINMSDLQLLNGWRPILMLILVILLVRPAAVFLSTRSSSLSINEKIFISWVGPRGIVAAGIASLFGLKLLSEGFEDAQYITPLVFMVVLGTVLLNATTARVVARMLGVALEESDGILILGASKGPRLIAKYLHDKNENVVLLDSNKANIASAKKMGLNAIQGDIYGEDISENLELNDVGYLMAMTSSDEVNNYAISKYRSSVGENGSFRLINDDELKDSAKITDLALFGPKDDFLNITSVSRTNPTIREVALESLDDLRNKLSFLNNERRCIPLFVMSGSNTNILPANQKVKDVKPGDMLVYMGLPIPELAEEE